MFKNIFPENNMHPLLHLHISHSIFSSYYLIIVVNGAQQIFFCFGILGYFQNRDIGFFLELLLFQGALQHVKGGRTSMLFPHPMSPLFADWQARPWATQACCSLVSRRQRGFTESLLQSALKFSLHSDMLSGRHGKHKF